MNKRLPRIILYIAMLLSVFFALSSFTSFQPQRITPQDGLADLTGMDLASDLVQIAAQEWAYYPGALYTPEDFERGSTIPPVYGSNASTSEYGTYRLRVKLAPGQIYAISGRSPNLSQRVYIDGQLAGEVGSPGASREETTPRTKTYEYYFLATGDATEFIFQIANFYHREGGRNTPMLLSQPSVIYRYRSLELIRSNIILGCMLTVSLYFLGMFIFSGHHLHFLYLALAALVNAVRMLIVGEKHIMEIFPELNWFVSIKLEYICLLFFVVFLLLYFHSLYPGMMQRWFIRSVLVLSVAFALIVLLTDSLFFSRIQPFYAIVWVAASILTLWGLFRKLRDRSAHIILILSGFATFFLTALYDELKYLLIDHVRLDNTLIIGMLICLYMNMIAVTLEFSEKEKELGESRVAIMLSQLQPHFLYNVLVIIKRLCDTSPADAKETVMDFSSFLRSNLDSLAVFVPIPFEKELEHVKTYLSLEKRRFQDRANCCYDIQCTNFSLPALTLQPIVENAVRYGITKKDEGGTITISTREEEKCFVISVIDDGVGFNPQEKKQDGRSHVGIENVRGRLAAMCGGALHIHSTPGVGTEVIIQIPKVRGGRMHRIGG